MKKCEVLTAALPEIVDRLSSVENLHQEGVLNCCFIIKYINFHILYVHQDVVGDEDYLVKRTLFLNPLNSSKVDSNVFDEYSIY